MSFVYSVEETSKAARGKGEKTSSTKKFKDIENDLEAAWERIQRFDELYKKMEAEYRATIAAMQKRIEELEGTKKQLSQMHVSIVFLPILRTQTGITAIVGARNAQKLPTFFRLNLMKFFLMSRTLREEWRALIIRPLICISLKKNGEHW